MNHFRVLRAITIAVCGAVALTAAITLTSSRAVEAAATGCAFPTHVAASSEATAWQLFVAANCSAPPGSRFPLVWENWPEQSQVYSNVISTQALAGASIRDFHVSPLAAALRRKKLHKPSLFLPSTGCDQMNGAGFIPPVVKAQMVAYVICEEVHINPDATRFIRAHSYQSRNGQAAAARNNVDIQFPATAIEVKTDWIPATDFKTPFSCSNPPAGLHVESVNNVCYAMAGMHISSKLIKDWIWATFEPQFPQTNPIRCRQFGPCRDAWGAVPAVSGGGNTSPTPALLALMRSAAISRAFLNYRLDGVQTQFVGPNGSATYLGNSVIEGENVGMAHNTASCITCHSQSTVNGKGVDGLNFIAPAVGAGCETNAGWIERDFVWSMMFGVPVPGPTAAPSSPPSCKNISGGS